MNDEVQSNVNVTINATVPDIDTVAAAASAAASSTAAALLDTTLTNVSTAAVLANTLSNVSTAVNNAATTAAGVGNILSAVMNDGATVPQLLQRMSAAPDSPHVQSHSSPLLTESPPSGVNGWTVKNYNTVKRWVEICNEMQFIYDSCGDHCAAQLQKIDVVVLIIGSIASIVTVMQLNDNNLASWLTALFRAVMVVLSISTTAIASYKTIKRYAEQLKSCANYVEQLKSFTTKCICQITLPEDVRMLADKFIIVTKDEFLKLQQTRPDIAQSDYINYKLIYQKLRTSGSGH